MRELENDLQNPPEVRVDRFKQTLRRELLAAMQPAPSHGLKLALVATSLAALLFAAVATTFVIAPAVPGRLHAALLHDGAGDAELRPAAVPGSPAPAGTVQAAALSDFLEQADLGAGRDWDFLESWYADQARSVRVRSVTGERVLAIRQFELSNGERVAVLTDLGAAAPTRTLRTGDTQAPGRMF